MTDETSEFVRLKKLSDSIMERIDEIPNKDELQSKVALIAGMAVGYALRARIAERELQLRERSP